jgi:hypothetical protein
MITKRMCKMTILLIVLGMMIGCSTARQMINGGASQTMVAESLEAMPPDAAMVTRALGNRLGGYTVPANVRLNSSANKSLGGSNVVEPGFKLQSACLGEYVNTGSGADARSIAGRMELQDGLNRRAAVAFEAAYDMQGAQAIVNTVRIHPLFDAKPETVCFVVPAKAVTLNKENHPKSFTAFYQYMGERALDPETVDSGERNDYVMAMFFMNRMSPSAKATLAVSDMPSGIQGYTKDSRYVDYNGWRVGLVSGSLALKNPKTESSVYLKAVYTPGKEAGFFRMAKLVGVYTLAQRK